MARQFEDLAIITPVSECKPISEECEEQEEEAGDQEPIEDSPSPIHTT
jgi:hypothetical protein